MLPFVHAVGGCDTTSRLFGIGKGVPLRKLKSDSHFRQQAEVFKNKTSKEEVFTAGEKALVSLYGGRTNESLDTLRYRRFCEKVSGGTSCVQVQTLPPTSAAPRYHSARVYYQVHEWMADQDCFDPKEWGWAQVQQKLEPLMTNLPAAPPCPIKSNKMQLQD